MPASFRPLSPFDLSRFESDEAVPVTTSVDTSARHVAYERSGGAKPRTRAPAQTLRWNPQDEQPAEAPDSDEGELSLELIEDAPPQKRRTPNDDLQFRFMTSELVVRKPERNSSATTAINSLMKAVHALWFDDLNRRMVRGQIEGSVAKFAHIAAAITVVETCLMLQEHGSQGFRERYAEGADTVHRQYLERLRTLVPVIEVERANRQLPVSLALLTRTDPTVRGDYLWRELVNRDGSGFDLVDYLYFATPVTQRLIAALAPKPRA